MRMTRWMSLLLLAAGCQPGEDPLQPVADSADPGRLLGTSWRVEDIDGGGGADRARTTLSFDTADRATGSGGCNRYFATLEISPGALRFGPAAGTKMACGPAVDAQEALFFGVLEEIHAFDLEGDGVLWLLDAQGARRVRLSRLPSGDALDRTARAAPDAEAALGAHVFECTDGLTVSIGSVDETHADVTLPDGKHRMRRERSASGARYADETASIWNEGTQATVEFADHHFDCTENRARSIRASAGLRGVQFRAVGQEPGWILEIMADRIEFVGDYGTKRASVPRPQPSYDPSTGETVFDGAADAHDLAVRIADQPCQDPMSGEPHQVTVTVILDAQPFSGCGDAL